MSTPRQDKSNRPKVGKVIAHLAAAYGKEDEKILKDIAGTIGTNDPHLTRETILGYCQKGATRLSHRFAHLVVNYLDGRRPAGRLEPVPAALRENSDWHKARDICLEAMQIDREQRFEKSLGSESAKRRDISAIAGVYATCRWETEVETYQQELLILSTDGHKKSARCHCTYVTQHSVMRGVWILLSGAAYCNLSGFHKDNTHEIASLFLARLENSHDMDPEVLLGFIAGTATVTKYPVAMPIVAVKIDSPSADVCGLGDLGDVEILRRFGAVQTSLGDISTKLQSILQGQMRPVVFEPSKYNSALRNELERGNRLVDDRFRLFCTQPFSGDI